MVYEQIPRPTGKDQPLFLACVDRNLSETSEPTNPLVYIHKREAPLNLYKIKKERSQHEPRSCDED